jgi:hypothetical protein
MLSCLSRPSDCGQSPRPAPKPNLGLFCVTSTVAVRTNEDCIASDQTIHRGSDRRLTTALFGELVIAFFQTLPLWLC